ncbi:MAG TPA: 2OG-Fe(II) oxygenase [Chitinophagales bacterium]|nr:2OG-Fe(II) oxygenase [Chitinophagales bacterium]
MSTATLTRSQLASAIAAKLKEQENQLTTQWNTKHADFDTRYFICDGLLPEDWIKDYTTHLPSRETLLLKSSIRERKRVGVDYKNYDPIIGNVLMAFQEPEVLNEITRITGLEGMEADPTLYASGISIMEQNDFLNPHLDNSHDGEQQKYRVINLLYYVSPGWKIENGGNFELWDINVSKPTEIHSKFNRLVVMETNNISYHSVNKVKADARRVCVSNYYFATKASGAHKDFRHITTFTGRPEEPVKRAVLKVVDGFVLNTVAKAFPSLLKTSKHRIKDK